MRQPGVTALRPLAILSLLATLSLFATGCGDDASTTDAGTGSTSDTTGSSTGTSPEGTLTVSAAWTRPSFPAATNAAVYLTIIGGATDDALVGAAVEPAIAESAELHQSASASSHDDGASSEEPPSDDHEMDDRMTMTAVESIAVPAGETVPLEPGGYHVMLVGLVAPLGPDTPFDLTLAFETGVDQVVTVEVRDTAPDDSGPLDLEIVVPLGAADRIAAGEDIELIPALLEFEVGDSLTILNEDNVVHTVGPYTVGPFQRVSQPFPQAGTIEGLCSIHPSGQVTIVIRD